MKILYIGHSYNIELGRQKIEILKKEFNINAYIIAPKTWKHLLIDKSEVKKKIETNIYYLPVRKPGSNKKYTYKNLLAKLTSIQPDIIHIAEEPRSRVTFQTIFLAKYFLKKKPKIVIFTWENIYKRFKRIYNLFEKFSIKNSDAIICGNNEAKLIMKRKNARCSLFVLPHIGVDLNDYTCKKIRSRKIRIGYLGRLVQEKGILLLIKAFARLPVENKHLLITGNGPLLEKIKITIQELELNKYVRLKKGVPHDKVPLLFKELDILVLPSCGQEGWKEQFGHVLISAMASKTCIIGSSSGAIPEVIGKCGLIFKEKDTDDLYKKLLKLINNKKLIKLYAQKGFQRVTKYYTNKVLAKKTSMIYKKLTG